jgi:type I restriction enzyme M protein
MMGVLIQWGQGTRLICGKAVRFGDTLGNGKTHDGFQRKRFHFMLANPPFGVEGKDQKTQVEIEHRRMGFSGRFGAGLPAINDGSLLFLQHMISKMHPAPDPDRDGGGEGSKIAIVCNGSPLSSGHAGSGPSNIRRWIIENDWLDAIAQPGCGNLLSHLGTRRKPE